MNIRAINNKVNDILVSYGEITLPVKIDAIAIKRGLRVLPYPLEDDISGILVVENGAGIIGYNQKESKVRRRFTVAHELGHFELHKDFSSIFYDKQFVVLLRSQQTPQNEVIQRMEQEANAFAAAILMPEHLLKAEISKREFDLADAEGLNELARLFNVSPTAMYYRIANLKLF